MDDQIQITSIERDFERNIRHRTGGSEESGKDVKEEPWCLEGTSAEVDHADAPNASDFLEQNLKETKDKSDSVNLNVNNEWYAFNYNDVILSQDETDEELPAPESPRLQADAFSSDYSERSHIFTREDFQYATGLKLRGHMTDTDKESRSTKVRRKRSPPKSKRYKCEICEKSFYQKGHLKVHNLYHEGTKPHTCDICNKSFTEKGHLNTHRQIHDGKKPFTCDVCEKSYTRMSTLRRHKMYHEGIKPYSCNVCNKSFTEKGCLNIHRLIHEGIRPYKCPVCEKTFTQRGHLKKHSSLHDDKGVQEHKCEVCGKVFSKMANLKRHYPFHDVKKFRCAGCEKFFIRITSVKNGENGPLWCDMCEKLGKLKKHNEDKKLDT